MKPWEGQGRGTRFSWLFRPVNGPHPWLGPFTGRNDPGLGHPTGTPPTRRPQPREDRTRLSEVTDARTAVRVRPHPSDPPRRPFVRPGSVTPGRPSPGPSSGLTGTGPPCPIGRPSPAV